MAMEVLFFLSSCCGHRNYKSMSSLRPNFRINVLEQGQLLAEKRKSANKPDENREILNEDGYAWI